MPFIDSTRFVCFGLLLLSELARAQSLDWVARFDDIAPGNEETRAIAFGPTGEMHVRALNEIGNVLFRVSAEGVTTNEFVIPAGDSVVTVGPLVDSQGTAYVAQSRGSGSATRFFVWKLEIDETIWTEHQFAENPARNIVPHHAAVDAQDGVIIVGMSSGRPTTVSLDAALTVRWHDRRADLTLRIPRPHSVGTIRVAPHPNGEVTMVAGIRTAVLSNASDLFVIQYGVNGAVRWSSRINLDPSAEFNTYKPGGIVIGTDGRVYVVCASEDPNGVVVLAFSTNGEMLWSDMASYPDFAPYYVHGVLLNPIDGGIYVASQLIRTSSTTNNTPDVGLLRYSPSGERLVHARFDRGENLSESLAGLSVDNDGNAYLAAHASLPGASRFWGLLVDPQGTVLRSDLIAAPMNRSIGSSVAFAVDQTGAPAFAGTSGYSDTFADAIVVQLDSTGGVRRATRLNTVISSSENWAADIVATDAGETYVAGYSYQHPQAGRAVITKYSAAGLELWRYRLPDLDAHFRALALLRDDSLIVAAMRSEVGNQPVTQNIVLLNLSPDGDELWRYEFDGGSYDEVTEISVNDDDEIILSGASYVGSPVARSQLLLLKISPAGQLVWRNALDPGIHSTHHCTDADGAIYLTGGGHFEVTKFSSDGVRLWTHWLDPAETSSCSLAAGYEVEVAPDGDVVVAGWFCNDSSHPTLALAKLGPDGDVRWFRIIDRSARWARFYSIEFSLSGDIFVFGIESEGEYGPTQLLTTRVSSAGEVVWLQGYPGDSARESWLVGIERDAFDNVYVAGTAAGPGPDQTDQNYILLRYDPSGELRWRYVFGDDAGLDDLVYAFHAASDGRLYLTGRTTTIETRSDLTTICIEPAASQCGNLAGCGLGDANADCRVDLNDLQLVLRRFGLTNRGGVSPLDGDLDFDGQTNLSDLALLLTSFGSQCD